MLGGWKTVLLAPDRATLDRSWPIDRHLSRAKAIYGYWLAGESWIDASAKLLNKGALKQVILPRPEKAGEWARLVKVRSVTPQDELVARLTREARGRGILVSWYPGSFLGAGLTFVNPHEKDGSLVIEVMLPQQDFTARPSFRLTRKEHSSSYDELWRVYEQILKESEPQP